MERRQELHQPKWLWPYYRVEKSHPSTKWEKAMRRCRDKAEGIQLNEDLTPGFHLRLESSPHFPVFPEFASASYLQRYNILCQKLVKEQHYSSASVIAIPRSASADGGYSELSPMTGLRSFVASLAGHIAAEAVR